MLELQVSSCDSGWKETCQATSAISATWRRDLSSSIFLSANKSPKEIHPILIETLGEHAPSYATVENWVALFKPGYFSTCDAPRPGRPKTVNTPEIIDQIHELTLEYHRISAKSVAGQLGISRERAGSIIHEDLDKRKLSAKWVPKCLNTDQKRRRYQSSEQLLEFFGAIQMMSCRDWWPWTKPGYITMTRRQSNNQWSGGITAQPAQKFRIQKSAGKVLASIFCDPDGILLIDYLPKVQTINAEYYSSLQVQLKYILKEKRRGKFAKGFLFLHDNAPTHRALATQKKLAYLGFQCLDRLQYFPGSGPVGLPPVPWTEKNNWRVVIYRPTRRSLLPRRPGWTDKLLNFLSGL